MASFVSFIEDVNGLLVQLVQCTRHFPMRYSITFQFIGIDSVMGGQQKDNILDIGERCHQFHRHGSPADVIGA